MQYSVPANARHGCMIQINAEELHAVLAAFDLESTSN
jgi:hypothetical protein